MVRSRLEILILFVSFTPEIRALSLNFEGPSQSTHEFMILVFFIMLFVSGLKHKLWSPVCCDRLNLDCLFEIACSLVCLFVAPWISLILPAGCPSCTRDLFDSHSF